MPPRCVPAAALAALLLCVAAAPASADHGVLVAQIAQAQPESELPPLTDDPPGVGEEPEPEPAPEPTPEPAPPPEVGQPELPATGAQPLLVALAGLGLLGAGAGLRRTADEVLGP